MASFKTLAGTSTVLIESSLESDLLILKNANNNPTEKIRINNSIILFRRFMRVFCIYKDDRLNPLLHFV